MSKLSLNELSGSLQAHEARFNRFSDKPKDKVFYMKVEALSGSGSGGSEN